MPKYVDHTARRLWVTEVAAGVVAARGVEALTVRTVAAEAGYSTALVSHYFADKRDLLRSTFRAAADRSTARLEEATSTAGRSVAGCLESLLPMTDVTRRDWRVFIAFWGVAATDDELGVEQANRVRSARQRVATLLADRDAGGGWNRNQTLAAARSLLTVVQGIAVQALFDPSDWSSRRQADELRRGVARILPSAPTTA